MWLVITEVPPSLYYFNSTLGRLIAKEPSKFKVAGTKDKRAISTQKVCIPFVNAEKLKTASKGMKRNWRRSGERAYVGNFSYEKESLELGDLQGNHFSIVLRDIKVSGWINRQKFVSKERPKNQTLFRRDIFGGNFL